jgi:tetratricopeptide (TPR) repeat protein
MLNSTSAVTGDQERFRSRLLAFGALWFFVTGLLMTLSFVVVALVVFAVVIAFALAAGAVWLLRRFEAGQRLWTVLVSTARAGRSLERRLRALGVRQRVGHLRIGARERAPRALERAAVLVALGLQKYAITVNRLRLWTSRGVLALTGSNQALRLNELGAQLRRRGDHARAAEQHRVALAIVRDLGDEESEALTLNSLALALAEGGAEDEAVRHLEQARVVLHQLGDEEHEGQVIANLGMVHRRQGHAEEAESLLNEALDKLPPESSAYRQVERELVRVG